MLAPQNASANANVHERRALHAAEEWSCPSVGDGPQRSLPTLIILCYSGLVPTLCLVGPELGDLMETNAIEGNTNLFEVCKLGELTLDSFIEHPVKLSPRI